MTDRRQTPANARVMSEALADDGSGRERVRPVQMQIGAPLTDLLRSPEGPRDRQLLRGDTVDLLEVRDGMAFVQAYKDGYVGYVARADLMDPVTNTHRVITPATHLYEKPDLKSRDLASLSFGSQIIVNDWVDGFAATTGGFVPAQHLRETGDRFLDPIPLAELFLGTPYLWGGNSRAGIDCSGLVQAACLACGIPCPGDSDQQQAQLGTALPADTMPERGDLLFWKGHVAWVVSPDTILHANAHTMSTNYENLTDAIARIAQTDGPVTAHKRLVDPV